MGTSKKITEWELSFLVFVKQITNNQTIIIEISKFAQRKLANKNNS
jgi:hypothetical protein